MGLEMLLLCGHAASHNPQFSYPTSHQLPHFNLYIQAVYNAYTRRAMFPYHQQLLGPYYQSPFGRYYPPYNRVNIHLKPTNTLPKIKIFFIGC